MLVGLLVKDTSRAAEEILSILQYRQRLFCQQHEVSNTSKVDRIILNIIFE